MKLINWFLLCVLFCLPFLSGYLGAAGIMFWPLVGALVLIGRAFIKTLRKSARVHQTISMVQIGNVWYPEQKRIDIRV